MNTFLWILQILLAFVFFFHGVLMFSPESPRARQFPYMVAIPSGLARFLAVAEVLAAIGLILPGLTGILPWLVPFTAVCLVIVLVGAIVFHIRRREYPNIVFNAILLVMAAFVAYGRFVLMPF